MALVVAVMMAGALRAYADQWFPITLHPEMYAEVLGAVALLPLAYAVTGLYPGYGFTPVERLRKRTIATTVCFSGVILFDYLARHGQWPRGLLMAAGMITLIIGPMWEAAIRGLLQRFGWWGEPAVVLGPEEKRRSLIKALQRRKDIGWTPVAEGDIPSPDAPALPGVSLALVTSDADNLSLAELADDLPYQRVVIVPDTGCGPSLWVAVRDVDARLGLEVRRNLLAPLSQNVKRALDLILGAAALLLIAPLIIGFGVAVRLISPGPMFFAQTRSGRDGVPFKMWKLRTMRPDAEGMLEKVIAVSPGADMEWDRSMKLRDDPRIIPGIGHFMRRFSIDELPQLWNVLRGEMSLVGPRPLPAYHLIRLDPVAERFRARVRPGITGLWQISGRSDVSVGELEHLDAYYVRNWSLWLDVHILARTVAVVLNGRGAR